MRRDSTVLDTLRAVAVLLVLGAHLSEVFAALGVPSIEPWHWHIGRLGVLLFFVHTSVVLMMSLQRTPLDGPGLAVDFYIRRAFRIYPLAIVTILGVAAAGIPPVPWGQPIAATPAVLGSNLLLVQNLTGAPSVLTPLWSLPLEVQMYLVLPVVFFAIRGGRRLSVAVLLWLGGVLVGLGVPMNGAHMAAFIPCFMSGVLAYCLAQRRSADLPFWAFGLALAAGILGYVALSALEPARHSRLAAWGICVGLGLLLPRFRETSSPLLRRAAAGSAKYSYGIYLSHMVSMWLVFVVLPGQPLMIQLALLAALLVLVPMALYHTIEAPFVRLGASCAAWVRRPSRAVPSGAA
ncbi:MAG TPA: acyltransferase [Burkholderiales bacterium]|nr:acyltransferase [Burkholderiales bacterium]